MPLFVDKGMLSGDKIGLFFLEVTSMEEMNFLGRDELFCEFFNGIKLHV